MFIISSYGGHVHFIIQAFSDSEDLKQDHHLPRVLHDFGVLFRQQVLVPALLQAVGCFPGYTGTQNWKISGRTLFTTWYYASIAVTPSRAPLEALEDSGLSSLNILSSPLSSIVTLQQQQTQMTCLC